MYGVLFVFVVGGFEREEREREREKRDRERGKAIHDKKKKRLKDALDGALLGGSYVHLGAGIFRNQE